MSKRKKDARLAQLAGIGSKVVVPQQEEYKLICGFISRKDAVRACEKWHYTGMLGSPPAAFFGFWEEKAEERLFLGTVVFSIGNCPFIGKTFGIPNKNACELMRVALRKDRRSKTSQILSLALKKLKAFCPKVDLVVSYADVERDHPGFIYQATNWFYLGMAQKNAVSKFYCPKRKIFLNDRSRNGRLGSKKGLLIPVRTPGKHKYVFVFNKRYKKVFLRIKLPPYPKLGDHDRPKALRPNMILLSQKPSPPSSL